MMDSGHTVAQPQTHPSTPEPPNVPPAAPAAGPEENSQHVRAVAIVDNTLRSAHRLRGVLAPHFDEFGLNDVRYTVLQFVHAASETGGCSQSQLADELQQSESSVSTLIERMRTSGLLYRLRSKNDRRRHVLMLTEAGRQKLSEVESCHAERMSALLVSYDSVQLEMFDSLLKKFAETLTSMDSIQDVLRRIKPHAPAVQPVEAPAAIADATPATPSFSETVPFAARESKPETTDATETPTDAAQDSAA